MVKIREEKFYKLYCDFMKAGLKSFDEPFVRKILFDEEQRKWGLWNLLMRNHKFFYKLKEYIELEVWIKLHPKIDSQMNGIVGYGTYSEMLPLYTILMQGLYTHMLHSGLELDMPLINGMYVTLEKFLLSPKISIKSITPLQGVKIKEDFEIEKGLIIKNIKNDENLEDFVRKNYETVLPENAIMHKFELPKLVNRDEIVDADQFYRGYEELPSKLIEALRLFKSGKIGGLETITTAPMFHDHKRQIESSVLRERFWFPDGDYQLKKEEFDDFKKFWIQYVNITKNENGAFLRRTIRRFMDYFSKERWNDKFLDLIICLEILFKNDEKDNSPKISSRLKKFLEDYDKSIFDNCVIAYRIRNDFVHGGNGESLEDINKEVLFKIDEKIEEYVRKSIKKFMGVLEDKSKTKQSIISKL